MPQINVLNLEGKKAGIISLPKEIFSVKINSQLMAQAVRVYLANQRKSGAKVKNRGEVSLTKAKWYRQKGTGRARHGAQSAPLFVGGGVAHGPRGVENYHLKMNRKMRKAALFSALTDKLKGEKLFVLAGLDKIEPKTKNMAAFLKKLKMEGKILLVTPKILANVNRSGQNLPQLELALAPLLNCYQVLQSDQLILMKESIVQLKKTFLGES